MTNWLIEHATFVQLILFAGIIISLWWAEKFVFAESLGKKWQHSSTNLQIALTALPVQLLVGVLLMVLSSWVTAHRWGLVYFLPNASSPWIKYVLMLFVLDFLDYAYHYAAHKIPGFWRFHLVHHTEKMVDVSTTLREHPGETLLRNIFLIAWVLIFGASFGVLIIRQTLQTALNIFSHTSIRLPPLISRVFGWVFMTPDLHRTHHHYKLPYTDRSYGDIFSIWDRIFGTFAVLSAKDMVFGLDTHMDDAVNGSYTGLLAIPFPKRRRIPVTTRPALHPQWAMLLITFGLVFVSNPAQAQGQDFTYKIIHPIYGDIGTFTESIAKNHDNTEININVRIAVKILGITVYREEGDRKEIFQGNRFVSLRSSTITNGDRLDVQGEVRGNHFVITTPAGVINAAADVFPSDPWMVKNRGTGTSVAIETGDVLATHITGGESTPVSLQDTIVTTRHFVASAENQHYEVWLNDRDMPVMFRSIEDGTPIDFILTTPLSEAAKVEAHLAPTAKLKPEINKELSGNL